jgi:hypothetical protein
MGRRISAAEYIEAHGEVAIILGELVESATIAADSWARAVALVRSDPDAALTALVSAEIQLDIPIRLQRIDSLRPIRRAGELLDRDLPNPDEAN